MTEAEWLTCDEWHPLHSYLHGNAKDKPREYRLASCGIYRLTWQMFSNKLESHFVERAEVIADDPNRAKRASAPDDLPDTFPFSVFVGGEPYNSNDVTDVLVFIGNHLAAQWYDLHPEVDLSELEEGDPLLKDWTTYTRQASGVGAHVLREIFGNPFRPVRFAPAWRTDTTVALARQMYDARDFSTMPILADALQDSGCDDASILDHCRGDGPHVRGCWVVDLILGKQ